MLLGCWLIQLVFYTSTVPFGSSEGKVTRLIGPTGARAILLQSSPPHSGSTVIANVMQGLVDLDGTPEYHGEGEELEDAALCDTRGNKICGEFGKRKMRSCAGTEFAKRGESSKLCKCAGRSLCVVKTHVTNPTGAWFQAVDPSVGLWLIVQVLRDSDNFAPQAQIRLDYHRHVLNQTSESMCTTLREKILPFLQGDMKALIRPISECIERLNAFNMVVESMANRSFSSYNQKYLAHGHHRNRHNRRR
jgi:hypothetical protein